MIKPSNDGDSKNNDNDKDGGYGGGDVDAVCGNGSIDTGELCDDGNDNDDDYCTNTCSLGQKMEQYCDDSHDIPCQDEMKEMQKTNTFCKQKLDACHRNPSDESLCQESKIACQADEKSEQDLRQCISKESRCLDKFFEHVRPDMKNGWERYKGFPRSLIIFCSTFCL
jgi:cysteine-rich repeat protein